MKIQYMSDLHLDFHQDMGRDFCKRIVRNKSADVLVIAGDMGEIANKNGEIGNFHQSNIKLLTDSFAHVIQIAGNHDYYKLMPIQVHDYYREMDQSVPGFHFLDNDVIAIDGKVIAGTTMWFRDDPLNFAVEHMLNDFRAIKCAKPWIYEQNVRSVEFIKQNAQLCDLMITHHLPSYQCVDEDFRSHQANVFYVTDILDRELAYNERLPAVWIHGHSHSSFDAMINGVRVLRNPAGYKYQSEFNKMFNISSTVEI